MPWFKRALIDIVLAEPLYPYYIQRQRKNFTFSAFTDLGFTLFSYDEPIYSIPQCTIAFLARQYDTIFGTMVEDCKRKNKKVLNKYHKNALIQFFLNKKDTFFLNKKDTFFLNKKDTLVYDALQEVLNDDMIGVVKEYIGMNTHYQLGTRPILNKSYFTFYSPIPPSNLQVIPPPTLGRLLLPNDAWTFLVDVGEFRRLVFDSFRTGGHHNNGIMGTLRESSLSFKPNMQDVVIL